jgi:hypothetical protein
VPKVWQCQQLFYTHTHTHKHTQTHTNTQCYQARARNIQQKFYLPTYSSSVFCNNFLQKTDEVFLFWARRVICREYTNEHKIKKMIGDVNMGLWTASAAQKRANGDTVGARFARPQAIPQTHTIHAVIPAKAGIPCENTLAACLQMRPLPPPPSPPWRGGVLRLQGKMFFEKNDLF